jgi:hypothetical protein
MQKDQLAMPREMITLGEAIDLIGKPKDAEDIKAFFTILKDNFKSKIKIYHSDKGGDNNDLAVKLIEAYSVIKNSITDGRLEKYYDSIDSTIGGESYRSYESSLGSIREETENYVYSLTKGLERPLGSIGKVLNKLSVGKHGVVANGFSFDCTRTGNGFHDACFTIHNGTIKKVIMLGEVMESQDNIENKSDLQLILGI